jgi:hypothetical protein
MAAAAVAALLRHRGTNPGPLGFGCNRLVDPPLGRTVALCHLLNYGLAGFAGRGFIANIDAAIAHDCYPLLKLHHNAQLLRKVACDQLRSAAATLRFTTVEQPEPLFQQRKVNMSRSASNRELGSVRCSRLKSLRISEHCFVGPPATKQFSAATKPFPAFRADIRKHRLVINPATRRRDSAGKRHRR